MRVRGNPFSGIFYAVIFTVNVYKLPINILKSCINLNSLTSVFGDIAHIPGALKVFTFNHLSKDVDGDPGNMFKVNNRNTKNAVKYVQY